MTRKEILNRLKEIGCSYFTYEDIHYYLKRNGWKLSQITGIYPCEDKGFCVLEVDETLIGIF